jgi:hypothetical protein
MTPTSVDARNRALRTFIQGLISDALIAGIATLTSALADPSFVFSRVYVTGVLLLIAKSVLSAVVAYVMRYTQPPTT